VRTNWKGKKLQGFGIWNLEREQNRYMPLARFFVFFKKKEKLPFTAYNRLPGHAMAFCS